MVLVIVAIMAMAMTSAMAASSVVAATIAAESAAAVAAVTDSPAEGASKPDQGAITTPAPQPPGPQASPPMTRDARSRRRRQQRQQKAARDLAEWTAELFSSRQASRQAASDQDEWPNQRPQVRCLLGVDPAQPETFALVDRSAGGATRDPEAN
jgi:type IV secretory pathway VirB10-like protein